MDEAIQRDLGAPHFNGNPSIQEAREEIDQDNKSLGYLCCHPNGFFHKCFALALMCFLGIGSYFCYDNPGSLQTHFTDMGLSDTQFQMLYSFYSWPNVFLCFVGGFLIDRVFGIRLGTNLYIGITLLGQLIFAFGAFLSNFYLMILGRFVFGIGAESSAVGQNNYAVLWFKGKVLNMVFGFQMSFVRVGSAVGFEVMAPIYNYVNSTMPGNVTEKSAPQILGYSLVLAGTTCVLSLICSIVLGIMDKRAEKITNRVESASSEVVKLSDVVYFKAEFWLICAVCVTFYSCIFPFISQGQNFYKTQFNQSDSDANTTNSLVYWIAAVISPIAGFIIDRTGRNIAWILFAVVGTILGHFLLGFVTGLTPYVGVALLGLGYSTLASSLWPLVAVIIPEYQLGTAYGVCQAIQNLGLAISAIIAGEMVDNWGYRACEYFFLTNLILALVFTILLSVINGRNAGSLDMSPEDRKLYNDQKATSIEPLLPVAQQPAEDIPPASTLTSYDENDIGRALESQLRNKYLQKPAATIDQ